MAAAAGVTLRRGPAMPRLVAALVILVAWQALAMSGLLFRDVVPQLQLVIAGLAGRVVRSAASTRIWR